MASVTVLTPAFNRAHTLERLWKSLCAQTFTDFEWLVVDDGSSDDTESLIRDLMPRSPFPVVYVRQDNQGKHIALNTGVRSAAGEYTAVIDADDWYEPLALRRMRDEWDTIDDPTLYAEVQALCADPQGVTIGDRFPDNVPCDSDAFEMAYHYGVTGDKAGMQRTAVLREYPFPDAFRGVCVTEALIWFRIAEKYRTRYINVVVKRKEYLPGGLTDTERSNAIERAGPRREFFAEVAQTRRAMPRKDRLRAYANWSRNSRLSGTSLRSQAARARHTALFVAMVPVGIALSVRDRLQLDAIAPSDGPPRSDPG